MRQRLFLTVFILCLSAGMCRSAFAISAAEKSMQDYVFTLNILREMSIMIDNFGTDDQRKKYDEIRSLFKVTAERHYAQAFIRPVTLDEDAKPDNNAQYSTELFHQLKVKLADLLNDISQGYITRSQQILDSTSKTTNDILIEYGRNTGLAKYFYRAIDPLVDVKKPYDTDKYHYFHDKETLERYLKNGYKSLQDARNLVSNADFIYVNNKKEKTDYELEYILNTDITVSRYCRQAKQCGIEIHKILNQSSLSDIQRKYNVALSTVSRNPIYDDRIPEDYKVDAVDNQKLVYKIERQRLGLDTGKTDQPQSQTAPTK